MNLFGNLSFIRFGINEDVNLRYKLNRDPQKGEWGRVYEGMMELEHLTLYLNQLKKYCMCRAKEGFLHEHKLLVDYFYLPS